MKAQSQPRSICAICVMLSIALTACGSDDSEDGAGSGDPIVTAALNENIMSDPDLTGQNRANAAISDGARNGSLPPLDLSNETIIKARNQAFELVGGNAAMQSAPEPEETGEPYTAAETITVLARAQTAQIGRDCVPNSRYSAIWAARLPEALPIYPLGAVQSAAGTDDGDCTFRAVNFVSPVPRQEILDFYFTKAGSAGFSLKTSQRGETMIISGNRERAKLALYASQLPNGATDVDLIFSEN